MSIEGGDRAPKMARKLGRGLGNLIPVPLPPKVREAAEVAAADTVPAPKPSLPASTGSTGNTGLNAAPPVGISTTALPVPPAMPHVATRLAASQASPAPNAAQSGAPRSDRSVIPPIPEAAPSTLLPAHAEAGTSYRIVPVASISRNPWQPREMFHEEQIRELAQSIESAGLMQPLVVRAKGKGFELIAGERRLRALALLKRTEAPVVIHDVDYQVAA